MAEREGAWQSTREHGRARESAAEHGRAWQSAGAQERTRKHKSMKGTWKPQNAQFQGLARHWSCQHLHSVLGSEQEVLRFAKCLSDLDDDNVDATVDDSAMVFEH
jgi:hypothetical protein